MRGTRWLLLVAIAAIIYGVGVTYQRQKQSILKSAVPAQVPMPANIVASYDQFHFTKTNQTTGCKVEIAATQATQAQSVALSGVTMKIFHKSGDQCNDKLT